jgi:hypothetical protein
LWIKLDDYLIKPAKYFTVRTNWET